MTTTETPPILKRKPRLTEEGVSERRTKMRRKRLLHVKQYENFGISVCIENFEFLEKVCDRYHVTRSHALDTIVSYVRTQGAEIDFDKIA